MKKSLYLSTALAAAGILAFGGTDANAKKIKIGLGGFLTTYVGWADQDGSFESTAGATDRVGYDSFNIINDTEVYFTGSTKLDNGVNVAVIIQMEGDPSDGAGTIDESYVKLTGGFGDLRMGSTKAAGSVLKHNAPGAGMIGVNGGDVENFIIQPTSNSVSDSQGTNIGGNDSQKLTYITPVFNGFRVGATYVPSTASVNTMPAVGGNAGTDSQVYDMMFSYEKNLGTVDLEADIGLYREQSNAASSIDGKRFGINLGFGAVTVGASYLDEGAVDSGQIGATNPNLEAMDIELDPEQQKKLLKRIVRLGEQKASITADDLPFIIADLLERNDYNYVELLNCSINSGLDLESTVSIRVRINDEIYKTSGSGNGGFDAFISAMKKVLDEDTFVFPELVDFELRIPPGGQTSAFTECIVTWEDDDEQFTTRGVNTNQVLAGIGATIRMINLRMHNNNI